MKWIMVASDTEPSPTSFSHVGPCHGVMDKFLRLSLKIWPLLSVCWLLRISVLKTGQETAQ